VQLAASAPDVGFGKTSVPVVSRLVANGKRMAAFLPPKSKLNYFKLEISADLLLNKTADLCSLPEKGPPNDN
jgi:hypothetical protein